MASCSSSWAAIGLRLNGLFSALAGPPPAARAAAPETVSPELRGVSARRPSSARTRALGRAPPPSEERPAAAEPSSLPSNDSLKGSYCSSRVLVPPLLPAPLGACRDCRCNTCAAPAASGGTIGGGDGGAAAAAGGGPNGGGGAALLLRHTGGGLTPSFCAGAGPEPLLLLAMLPALRSLPSGAPCFTSKSHRPIAAYMRNTLAGNQRPTEMLQYSTPSPTWYRSFEATGEGRTRSAGVLRLQFRS
mmetsp:Transcript_14368/g.36198  ORF Transcript_14368/g.36198 Transcript_14368/m.36198 type:complete len:246 (+) Transcript_14368:195-932(+)